MHIFSGLGTFYQRAYSRQPFLFRDSANDGFHEAIGDTISLSITQEYLLKLGFIDKAPDAKYDVPANYPYARYFLADILQFQFHRALARIAGCIGPLNRCSIYGNREAGKRLSAMLEMGQSKPWPEALYTLTGERRMDAAAIREHFAPLEKWLDEQNCGKPVGW